MNNIKERVSYLKGLSDGLNINEDTKDGKLLIAIIDVLDEIAEELEIIGDNQDELDEYVDAIDQDLAKIEDELYDEDEEDFDEEDGYIEVECPNCHETVYLDEDMFGDEDEEILCPNCNEPIVFDCCDDNECDCHDHSH